MRKASSPRRSNVRNRARGKQAVPLFVALVTSFVYFLAHSESWARESFTSICRTSATDGTAVCTAELIWPTTTNWYRRYVPRQEPCRPKYCVCSCVYCSRLPPVDLLLPLDSCSCFHFLFPSYTVFSGQSGKGLFIQQSVSGLYCRHPNYTFKQFKPWLYYK